MEIIAPSKEKEVELNKPPELQERKPIQAKRSVFSSGSIIDFTGHEMLILD